MSAEAFDLFADNEGGQEGAATPSTPTSTPATPEGTPASPAATPAVAPSPNAELAAALREFAASNKAAAAEVKPANQALTKEQLAEHYRIYNPTAKNPKFFEEFMGLPDDMDPAEKQARVGKFAQLFAGMQQGLIEQAVTIAQRNFEKFQSQFEERLTPLQQAYADQQAQVTRNEFYTTYPILKDPRYEGLIKATASSIADQNFDTKADYYKALAEGVAGAIKGFVPNFDLGATPQTKQTGRTTPRLPRTSAGGTGGAGGAAQQQTSANEADSLF